MKNTAEAKRANRKALPKFLLALAIAVAVGFTFGWFAVELGLDNAAEALRSAGAFFGANIAPLCLLACAVALPLVCVPVYRGAKRLLNGWDGEDEDVSERAEAKLSFVLRLTGSAFIINFFLLTAAYSGGFDTFDSKSGTALYMLAVICFLAVMVESVLLQQRCVDAAKITHPEKSASVYDLKFRDKWYESCDEAEKSRIGACALKAYRATNTACTVLAGLLAIGALVFDTGFLPALAVCAVWLANQSAYFREAASK